ncbi:MAG: endonuclease MutS2 [Lachnospiraceae bacterium]|nr:endonuclease MutS2 [Lachnospiraceae bacterium]
MNNKCLKTLEYNKIIDMLEKYTISALGKGLSKTLLPMTDITSIKQAQKETSDALSRIYKKGSIPMTGIKDITPSLLRLDVGSTLGMGELLSISHLLTACARAKSYARHDTDEYERDSLDDRFDTLMPLTNTNEEIMRCILSEDTMSDDASSTLKNIRKQIQITNNKIREHLNTIINSSDSRTMLQDNIITMRNNRYCIPVKQEHKSSFKGMIHDQSATGSTVFIEPAAVVKYNNELAELAASEQTEIEKILSELSILVHQDIDFVKNNLNIMTELDFIFAKGMLAKEMRGSMPVYTDINDKTINIKQGRHPLIDKKKVVPIDINLGIDFNLLVITGPNTGGKTVSLKTVGLFSLMGQAGLHIPAFDGSKLAVFNDIYADIGDEQSIEQSLSTFSSHMTNTISIINKADSNSLVLFDELGAGTDPTEGAALARAILNHFHTNNILTMATTHYSEIKVFALETLGVENACCEFDVASLAPTYRLLIGVPGKSNAFAISKKLGLPDFIIDVAGSYIDSSDKNFEDVINELENSRLALEKERALLKASQDTVDTLTKELEEKNSKLAASKDKILRKANEEARDILRDAKEIADKTIRDINKASTAKDMEAHRSNLGKKLKKAEEKSSTKKALKAKRQHSIKDFKLGDTVNVISMGLKGTVTSLPNSKGDLQVQMGIFNSKVNISDLEIIDEAVITAPNFKKTGSGKIKMSKSASISPELNIIGMYVDEAMGVLDKYLDDAYLAHLPQVTIIHGRGTGALKNAVHAHLRKTKYVKDFRLGGMGEGDYGVTIVEFK